MLELLRARLASLEARTELDKGIENPSEAEQRSMDADAKETELVKAEIEKLENKDDDIEDVTPENREMNGLVSKCSIGKIIEATVEGRQTEGPEAELQKELGLESKSIPLRLLREERAVTNAPGKVGQNQAPILLPVFPRSAAAFLGVSMPSVGVGDAVYPVLTTREVAEDVDRNAPVAETTGTFEAEVLTNRRIQASFIYNREDRAKFAGMDSALRTNLNDSLGAGLDKYILTKSNLGLFDFGADPVAGGSIETYTSYKKGVYGMIDGRYAVSLKDVKMLIGPKTYEHMGIIYRTDNSDESALQCMMNQLEGIQVSAFVPEPESDVQQAVATKGMGHSVAPIWENIDLIVDEVTLAKKGQICITAVMQMNFRVLRSEGYKRFAFKLA